MLEANDNQIGRVPEIAVLWDNELKCVYLKHISLWGKYTRVQLWVG
jgi:hypothetical protein